MDLGIAGKVAMVVGGSQGLGLSVARSLAGEGAKVLIVARNAERLRQAVAGLRRAGGQAEGLTADVTERTQVETMFAAAVQAGLAPDILVYNTGGPPRPNFFDATDEEHYEAYRNVVLGFSWMVQAAFPHMSARGWGRIVTLGSLAVKEVHVGAKVLHNLNRLAAAGLSKSLSDDLGPYGITVNTIGLGAVYEGEDSGGWRRIVAAAAARGVPVEAEVQRRLNDLPVRRFGTADEMGGLCAYLCSQQAGFITGQTILLDGGQVRAPV